MNAGNQSAGSKVQITDKNGKVLASYQPEKSYVSVVISSPDLRQGESYTVTAGSYSKTITLSSLIYGESGGSAAVCLCDDD